MIDIKIGRPKLADRDTLEAFFQLVITDTFLKEGIRHLKNEMESEIASKKIFLEEDFESNGEKRYFLIATVANQIIGSIGYGPANELICACTNNQLKDVIEIGTVFVHPSYQNNGVGSLLLKAMYHVLWERGIEEFCLDSGYRQAQKIWKRKFGIPQYWLRDYWGAGSDHMIWRVQIRTCLQ